MIKKISRLFLLILLLIIITLNAVYFYNSRIIESHNSITSAPSNTKFITVEDEYIAYQKIDNHASRTVLFIGGVSAWGNTWQRTMQSMNSKDSTLNYMVLDLPPFGYSIPNSTKNYFRDTQAIRIAGFVDRAKLNHIILVAHSYGAGPSAEYVLKNPGKVDKFIIIDGVLNIDEPKRKSFFSLIQCNYLRNLLLSIAIHSNTFTLSRLKSFVHITDHIDQSLLAVYTRYFNTRNVSMKLSFWLRDYLTDPLDYSSNNSENYKHLSIPVRLIWGDKDTVTPIDSTSILLSSIPNIKLKKLENIGHIPMIEDYNKFDAALIQSINH